MDTPKKGRLIGGIILAAIGIIGLGGIGKNSMGGGLALILTYVKSIKRYNAFMQEQNARNQREQELKDARQELERQKVDSELQQLRADAMQTRICPHCGGSTKGEICEYCGSRLEIK